MKAKVGIDRHTWIRERDRAMGSGASAHYGTAKAAVIICTRCLAQELGPFGIPPTASFPG